MRCAACGTVNSDTAKFCAECGTPLATVCGTCGTPYKAGARFCSECGAALAPGTTPRPAPAQQAQAPASGGTELRQVSVLFCDLVGYTALSEQRDAEDVRELLSGYFDAAHRVVDRYGGAIEKFIGDAVMAVWGSPVAREDDADRAVRAAIDLVEEVQHYGETKGLSGLQARAGVVTGQAASWATPGESLVVGDRVNTAARVQATAEPGTVFVDDVTKQVTAASIAYADAGLHTVKGKVEPLQLWRAVRVVANKGGAQRIDGLEAAFVGRARELNLVKELFHASAEEGRTRLVIVTGQAGVGKSRLRWEFDKYVDGVAFDVWWHSGRCLSYGEGVAYWALSEMVRARMGIAEEDSNEVATEKLAAGLERYIDDPAAREYLSPALGVLVGIADPGLAREELFAGWRMFLELLAAKQPVVMVFEDMQWADAGLLDFVEQLLDWSATHPIFVLSFARPELTERRPDWAAGRRNATHLYLDALSDAAMGSLLDDLVPDLPSDVRTKIVSRAAGIPLYAVEIVRGLIDRDIVVPQEGVYRLVGPVGDLDLPASLTALIGARLDALSPVERSALRTMSVLGSTFPRSAATAVVDLPEAELDAVLQSLLRKEILTVHSDPLSPDRGQYAFVQGLMRSVAYDTISKRERKALHKRVADHLRRAFPEDGEDVVEVVAAHYRDAYRAGAATDPDADDLRAEAFAMYVRAGKRARAVGAPGNAVKSYRVAAELAVDEAEAAELLVRAGELALLAGNPDDAYEVLDRARKAHLAAGREHAALLLAVPLSRALSRSRRLADGETLLRAAMQQLPAEDPALGAMSVALGRITAFTGDTEEAWEHIEAGLVIAENFEQNDVLVEATAIKALLLSLRDRNNEAIMLFRGTLDLLGEDGDPVKRINAHHNCADLLQQSDMPGAEPHLQAVIDIGGRIGDRPAMAFATANRMALHIFKGEWDDANRIGHAVVDQGVPVVEYTVVRAQLAALCALRGDQEGVARHFDHMELLLTSDDVQDKALYTSNQAFAAMLDGRNAEAFELARDSAQMTIESMGVRTEPFRLAWPTAVEAGIGAGRHDDVVALMELVAIRPVGQVPPYLRAHLRRFRGLLGTDAEAEENLNTAATAMAEMGYPYWEAVVRTDLAEWLVRQRRQAEAAAVVEAVTGVFDRLGAVPQQRRIAALRTQAGVIVGS